MEAFCEAHMGESDEYNWEGEITEFMSHEYWFENRRDTEMRFDAYEEIYRFFDDYSPREKVALFIICDGDWRKMLELAELEYIDDERWAELRTKCDKITNSGTFVWYSYEVHRGEAEPDPHQPEYPLHFMYACCIAYIKLGQTGGGEGFKLFNSYKESWGEAPVPELTMDIINAQFDIFAIRDKFNNDDRDGDGQPDSDPNTVINVLQTIHYQYSGDIIEISDGCSVGECEEMFLELNNGEWYSDTESAFQILIDGKAHIFYEQIETRTDWNCEYQKQIEGLSPTARGMLNAVEAFYYQIEAEYDNVNNIIMSSTNLGRLNAPISRWSDALQRLLTAMRENGIC